MKYIWLLLTVLLAGCASMNQGYYASQMELASSGRRFSYDAEPGQFAVVPTQSQLRIPATYEETQTSQLTASVVGNCLSSVDVIKKQPGFDRICAAVVAGMLKRGAVFIYCRGVDGMYSCYCLRFEGYRKISVYGGGHNYTHEW